MSMVISPKNIMQTKLTRNCKHSQSTNYLSQADCKAIPLRLSTTPKAKFGLNICHQCRVHETSLFRTSTSSASCWWSSEYACGTPFWAVSFIRWTLTRRHRRRRRLLLCQRRHRQHLPMTFHCQMPRGQLPQLILRPPWNYQLLLLLLRLTRRMRGEHQICRIQRQRKRSWPTGLLWVQSQQLSSQFILYSSLPPPAA